MKAKYVNPFTNFGLKKFFGEEASKPIPGDLNHAALTEVKDLMKGDGSGRVQR